jgi:hypothetical protein
MEERRSDPGSSIFVLFPQVHDSFDKLFIIDKKLIKNLIKFDVLVRAN